MKLNEIQDERFGSSSCGPHSGDHIVWGQRILIRGAPKSRTHVAEDKRLNSNCTHKVYSSLPPHQMEGLPSADIPRGLERERGGGEIYLGSPADVTQPCLSLTYVTWPITSLGSCMILRDQLVRLLTWDPPSDDQDHLQGGPHGHRVTTCTFADYRGCYRGVLCGKSIVYSSFHITMLLCEKV